MSGSSSSGAALEKCDTAPGHVGRKAGAQEIGLGELTADAVVAHHAQKWPRLAAVIHEDRRNVVLQIATDAGQRDLHGYIVPLQFLAVPQAGQHQELRRVDDPTAENHFPLGPRRMRDAALLVLDARCAAPLDQDPPGEGMDFDPKV